MSGLADTLDELILAVTARNVAVEREKLIRESATDVALAEWDSSGADRWRRPSATVSVVHPQPCTDVFDRDALVAWLVANGHGDLVAPQVTVVDVQTLASLWRESDVRAAEVDPADRPSSDELLSRLREAVSVTDGPVTDVWEQLIKRGCEVSDVILDEPGGLALLVTPDGELVPGIGRLDREPSQIRVALDSQRKAGT